MSATSSVLNVMIWNIISGAWMYKAARAIACINVELGFEDQ